MSSSIQVHHKVSNFGGSIGPNPHEIFRGLGSMHLAIESPAYMHTT